MSHRCGWHALRAGEIGIACAHMSEHGGVRNPFDSDQAARRYARARPYYHRSALRLAARQQEIGPALVAVDVGCGTGLSARAARDVAGHVIAVDISAAMVRAAERYPHVCYLVAAAERMPLGDAAADLATVGGAFHWFDQPSAFPELARVLRGGASLVVYTDFFHGRLAGQPGFADWLNEWLLSRYPSPARHAQFDPGAAERSGFGSVAFSEGGFRVRMTRTALADYLLSQSNAARAIETGVTSAEALRNQILDETAAYFDGRDRAEAVFGIRVWTAIRHRH
jgi:SAM-dependent methyltransferase